MATLREWFAEFTDDTSEVPESIVFGGDASYSKEWEGATPFIRTDFSNVPAGVLDREFDDGYGGNDSPDLCAWSPSWVLFSSNYDGSESLRWVPRHPIAHPPIRPGGG